MEAFTRSRSYLVATRSFADLSLVWTFELNGMKRANLLLSCIGFCLLALEPSSATSSGSSDSGPSVALTRQAIELGLEPSALGELWRTKQPLIISKPDALGQLYTTTYELTPDGQHITSTSVKEDQPQQPTSTSTSTVSPPAAVQPTNPQTDWEYVPSNPGYRRNFVVGNSSPFGANWPNFGGTFPQFHSSSGNNWPSFDFPAGITPQTTTKTEKDDQGRTVTTTIKTYKGPGSNSWSPGTDLSANWPSFELPTGATPQTSTKTEIDDQGRTVTTLTRSYKSPIFTTWSTGNEDVGGLPASWQPAASPWFHNPHFVNGVTVGDVPSLTPSAANPVPTPLPLPTRPTFIPSQPPLPTAPPGVGVFELRTTTPLPALEDFLKQTGSGESTPKTVATINIDELPVSTRTRITNYSGTFNGSAPPKAADLEPQVRDMLNRGGITDEDIQNAQALGNDVTRTRVLPDGRIVKTTMRVNNWAAPSAPTPQAAAARPLERDNSIDNFLAQVNLTPADIQAQNGEVIKTIVDQNGRVLSARFVLSSVKGEEQPGQGQAEHPTK
ncbi:mucin-2-like [Drosophila montana]|uniref:mucin-2-like n=1 Tax=Drosophila montana TaxID=40370 RepID=UPI00313CBF35